MSKPVKEIYVFGEFRLHPAEHLLTRQGQAVPLAPKVFETLVMLVRNAGQLVTKDAFMKQLWPEVFVEEVTLAQNVSQLRKALGDGADGAQLIQTVPKRGYRFIAPVQVGEDEQQQPAIAVAAAARPASVTRTRPVFVVAGMVVLVVAILAAPRIRHPLEPKLPRMTAITFSGRAEPWGGLQVDGSRLDFLERRGSTWFLMQTSVAGGEPTAVAAPPNTRIFGLSPDRSQFLIGSFADMAGNMSLWSMPAQGGARHRVGDVIVDEAVWFPDGQRILATSRGEIFSVDSDGGNRHRWFAVNGQAVDFSWRPDGRSVRFTVTDPTGDLSLWEASADGGNPHRLLADWHSPHAECCGAWMPNGKDYVFSAIRDGHEDVWLLREPAGFFGGPSVPVRLTAGPYQFSTPRPNEDGTRIFVFGVHNQETLVRYDTRQGSFIPFPVAGIHVAVSRDGEWIASVDSTGVLWRSRPDGKERLQLTSTPLWVTRPRWSPDGTHILFVGQSPGALPAPLVIARDGGAAAPPVKDLHGGYADWLPDGASIVVDILEGAGASSEMSVIDLKTGGISKVPGSSGLIQPRWSPDGRYMAAVSHDFKMLHVYDVEQRRWSRVTTAHLLGRYQWGADGRDLYFQDLLDAQETIFRWDAHDGRIDRVLDFSRELLRDGIIRCSFEGFAPDGSYLASIRSNFSNVYALDVDLR